jgi:hypothetical protein
MRFTELVLAVCVALTPERLRPLREEQWRADLRDGPDLGISELSLLIGALCSSSIARFHESLRRSSILLSHLTRGKNMKIAMGLLVVGVVAVGGTVIGINAARPKTDYAAVAESKTIMGYEGWWNSTPADGSGKDLPQETVAVNTTTGQIVDAFNRAKNDAHQPTSVSDVHFDVLPDPGWPAKSVVIIDTATGKVIESFPVDEKGRPVLKTP